MDTIKISKVKLNKTKGCNCIPSLPKDKHVVEVKQREIAKLILDIKKEGNSNE